MALKFFGATAAKDVAADSWTQMEVYRVIGKLRINDEVNDDAFDIKFPVNARVEDMTGDRSRSKTVR
jgi:hypothetical protein